jgi:hypothetical protein
MAKLLNRVKLFTATTGTGTITLGAAFSTLFGTVAEAGGSDGDMFSYVIEDGHDFELGVGTYTASGTTFSRDTVRLSKIAGTSGTSKINLSGNAVVFLSPAREDLLSASEAQSANAVLAGPASGGAAAPAFRALVAGDLPAASATAAGAIEIADATEMEAASAGDRAVPPALQHLHPSAAKVWLCATVSSGTPTLLSSYNVTSIADTGAGRLTVTIDTDFSSANWSAAPGICPTSTNCRVSFIRASSQAAGTCEITCVTDSGTPIDPLNWYLVGYGDQ